MVVSSASTASARCLAGGLREILDAEAGLKGHTQGTHRSCDPQETRRRIEPFLAQAGVVRVAEITAFDNVGVSTFEALRPSSRTLSVTHGKGLTPTAAWVSAAMEALERHAAERNAPLTCVASIQDIARDLPYDVLQLPRLVPSLLTSTTLLEWTDAVALPGGAMTVLPRALGSLDSTIPRQWSPSYFLSSSNGWASGNTTFEALVHALCELIERDAIHRCPAEERIPVDLLRAGGAASELVELFLAAGNEVSLTLLPHHCEAYCFAAHAWSPSFPVITAGSGCHLDPEVAACRALTEAAQTRLELLTGMREDHCFAPSDLVAQRGVVRPEFGIAPGGLRLDELENRSSRTSLRDDFLVLVRAIVAATGMPLLAFRRGEDCEPFSVVRVCAPGLHTPS